MTSTYLPQRSIFLLTLLLITFGLTACGGGGGATSTTNTTSTPVSSTPNSSTPASSTPTSSVASSVAVADTAAPSVPTQMTKVDATKDSIHISWNPATDNIGVTHYKIYRGSDLVATVSASQTDYTDTNLVNKTTYSYSVSAGDAAGNWSARASAVNIKTLTGAISGDALFQWSTPVEREDKSQLGNGLGGYEIRYKLKTASDYVYQPIESPSATSYTLTSLSGEYDFEIAAYDQNELYSDFIAIEPL